MGSQTFTYVLKLPAPRPYGCDPDHPRQVFVQLGFKNEPEELLRAGYRIPQARFKRFRAIDDMCAHRFGRHSMVGLEVAYPNDPFNYLPVLFFEPEIEPGVLPYVYDRLETLGFYVRFAQRAE